MFIKNIVFPLLICLCGLDLACGL